MAEDTSEPDVIYYTHYCPPGVLRVLANGTATFVGEVDDFTVLKYPAEPGGDLHSLEHEYRIYKHIGPPPRIIAAKNFAKEGLYLERAPNGTIHEYLAEGGHSVTIQRRVAWVQQLVEAVQHLHRHNIIHTDLHPGNVLLDGALEIKLADMQCNLLSEQDETIWFGERGEPCRYYCPRDDSVLADVKTDLFALGSTIHFIMLGHEVFPDIVSGEDGWYDMVTSRFERSDFPSESHVCAGIAEKCWRGEYSSADEVMDDVTAVNDMCERAP
ncbi:hypothetical protein LTR57_017434 [Friedmanniomyces endolithicus]|nr:hypothetical protein LTR75_013306 [Friedmanniomyces endolithicus]KAK0907175.1 hypothetical protein LTR57_017434 [Friedmanniomyces endolithicus]